MKKVQKNISHAIIISDIHLGWVACNRLHVRLLDNLHKITDKAELIIFNVDIIDHMSFGHFHYTVNGRPVYRSGSCVSEGQTGVQTGLPRYRGGRFERLDLVGEEWVPCPLMTD
jgi:hypothetical protein